MFVNRCTLAGALLVGSAQLLIAGFCAANTGSIAKSGAEVEGITEPYRTINVAADETGVIADMLVREGDAVVPGQPLATLNSDVHLAQLAIAAKSMDAVGRLDAVRAELQLRKDRLAKFEPLRKEGYARQEEVDRARADVDVADANVRAITEDLLLRKLEHEKLKAQLERRTVHAPCAGVIKTVHKQQGEYVAPNDPVVLTLVELDPLVVAFTIMTADVDKLQLGQKVKVTFPSQQRTAHGTVEYIAPTTDAESGIVRGKLRIENPAGQLRSGERCTFQMADQVVE